MNTEQMLVAGATGLAIDPKLQVVVRDAVEADADAIVALIGQWAERGLTLGRTREDVVAHIDEFAVVAQDGIIACAALEPINDDLAEIRSVSVSERVLGTGAGRLVVEGLLARATRLGMEQVVLLTKTPAFFAKVGFSPVSPEALPAPYVRSSIIAKGRTLEGRTAMSKLVGTAGAGASTRLVADAI